MDKETFDKHYKNLLRKATDVRRKKEREYFSEEDVLESFKYIALLRETSTPETIMNLGAKSIQSISTMVNREFNNAEESTPEQWDEKFVDAINYLLKLYASIKELS